MSGNKEQKLILGVDIGGTKIAAALATAYGEIVARGHSLTPAQAGPDAVTSSVFNTIEETMASGKVDSSQLLGIGIAVAGIIDSDNGEVISSPNLPGWHEMPLGVLFSSGLASLFTWAMMLPWLP